MYGTPKSSKQPQAANIKLQSGEIGQDVKDTKAN
jgi:hypothetical protein